MLICSIFLISFASAQDPCSDARTSSIDPQSICCSDVSAGATFSNVYYCNDGNHWLKRNYCSWKTAYLYSKGGCYNDETGKMTFDYCSDSTHVAEAYIRGCPGCKDYSKYMVMSCPSGYYCQDGRCIAAECTPGQTQSQACGNCGTQTRTCQSNYEWGSWSSCTGQGPCSPGQTQSQACGNCGTQTRTCQSNCQWGSWSSCTGQGPCSPGICCGSDCQYLAEGTSCGESMECDGAGNCVFVDSDGDGTVDSDDSFPGDPCSIITEGDNCGGTGCEKNSQAYIDGCPHEDCEYTYVGQCKGRLQCMKLNGNYGLVDSCEYGGRCCNIYGFSCIGNDCDLTPTEEECNTRSKADCDKDGCFWDYKGNVCSSCLNIYSCSDYNKCDGEIRCNDVCGVALGSTQGCRTGFEMVEGNLYEIDTSSCACEWGIVDETEQCYLSYDRVGGPGGFTYPMGCSDVIESECVGEVLTYTRTIIPEEGEPTVITGKGLCGSAASPLAFFSFFNVIGVVMLIVIYYVCYFSKISPKRKN